MDIVILEKSAFEQLLAEARQLTQRVESLSRKCQDKRFQKWLTGEEVCAILKISQRSLQTLRSKRWSWLSVNRASIIIYNNV